MAKKIKAYGYYETSSMTGYGITELFDEFSKSTLHLSVSLLEMKILYHLNKIDGQINGKDEQGNTALHLAAKGTNPEIVKCLISLGASRTEMNNEGKTPSEIANLNRNERNLEVNRQFRERKSVFAFFPCRRHRGHVRSSFFLQNV